MSMMVILNCNLNLPIKKTRKMRQGLVRIRSDVLGLLEY
jgi:hypothetical protein